MPSTVHDQTHQVIKRTKKDEKLRIGSSGKMQAVDVAKRAIFASYCFQA
jgi:hypothetical protein